VLRIASPLGNSLTSRPSLHAIEQKALSVQRPDRVTDRPKTRLSVPVVAGPIRRTTSGESAEASVAWSCSRLPADRDSHRFPARADRWDEATSDQPWSVVGLQALPELAGAAATDLRLAPKISSDRPDLVGGTDRLRCMDAMDLMVIPQAERDRKTLGGLLFTRHGCWPHSARSCHLEELRLSRLHRIGPID